MPDPDTFNTAHVLKPEDDYLASLRSTQAGVLDDLRAENERLQAQLDHALNVMNDQTAGSHHVFAENKRLRAALRLYAEPFNWFQTTGNVWAYDEEDHRGPWSMAQAALDGPRSP